MFSEKPGRLGPDHIFAREGFEICTALEGGVELQYGFRPKASTREFVIDELLDALVGDVNEALQVVAIFRHDLIAQREYIK